MTPKQELFCKEYMVDLNATQAAIRAGYSAKTAEKIGSENLRKPEIAEKIQLLMNQRSQKTEITAQRVLEEIAKLAFLDIGGAYKADGSLMLPHEMPEDVRRAIAGIEVNEIGVEGVVIGHTKKVKFHDKSKNLEMLGRHLKLFTDVLEVKDVTPLADRMKQARERAKTK